MQLKEMRLWRNWQTRTFEGRMGDHPGSSPGNRTKKRERIFSFLFFLIAPTWGANREP